MTKRAQLPDGRILEFPDDTSDAVIQRVVKQQLGVIPPEGAPTPTPAPTPAPRAAGTLGATPLKEVEAPGIFSFLDYFTDREGAIKRDREYRAYLQDKLQRAELEDMKTQTGFFDRLSDLFSRGLLSARSGIKDVEAAIETDPTLKKQFTEEARRFAADSRMEISGATTEQDVKDNFLRNVIPYIIEKGAESIPEMIAMTNPLGVLGVGLPANLGRQGRDAAELQGRQDVSGTDLAKVAPGAVAVTALDTLGLGGILGAPAKTALGRIGKAALIEGSTEAIQSAIEYANPRVVTGSDIDAGDMFEQAAFGFLAGGGIGGGLRGTGELVAAPFRPKAGAQTNQEAVINTAVRTEFQRLASQEVAAVMAANPDLTQDAAVEIVRERAEELVQRAQENVVARAEQELAAEGEADAGVVGEGLGEPVPSVSTPPVGTEAEAGALTPTAATEFDPILLPIYEASNMAKRKEAAKPIINGIIDQTAGDVVVPAKVTNQIADQMAKRAARREVFDPVELTQSVLVEKGIIAAPEVTAPSSTGLTEMGGGLAGGIGDSLRNMLLAKVEAGDVTENGQPSAILQAAKIIKDAGVPVDAPMLERIQAAVDSARGTGNFNAAMRAFVIDTVQRAQSEPTTAVDEELAARDQEVSQELLAPEVQTEPTVADTATVEKVASEPQYTPQQIVENIEVFAAQEARDRGFDPGMFREGAVDVVRGREPLTDQQILDAQGPEYLDAYKAGMQFGRDRMADAQPRAVEPEAAPTARPGFDPETFRNIVGEVPSIGQPVEGGHVTDPNYNYRQLSQAEIDAIRLEGWALPQAGARKRGANKKHWASGNGRLHYKPDNIVIRTPKEGFTPNTPIRADRIEVWNAETGQFETIQATPTSATAAAAPPGAPDQTFEDIGETPATTELVNTPSSDDIFALAEELPEAERVNVRARLDRIMANYAKDGNVDRLLGSLEALREDVDRRIDRDRTKRGRDRVRGFERAMEVIYRAERTGQISPGSAALIRWLLEQNPAIADDLALSLRAGGVDSPAGQYVPAARIATIFTSKANDGTAVHEVLHHTERLMPDNIRDGIRAEWAKRIRDLIALADKTDNTDMREVLGTIVLAHYGDPVAQATLRDSFNAGTIPYSVYHLSNPSEFWAVSATDLVGRRAGRTGWRGAARNWIEGLIEKAKSFFGLPSDAAVIAGLNAVLTTESGAIRGEMLATTATTFADIGTPDGTEPLTDANVDTALSAKLTKAQLRRLEEAAGIRRMKLSNMQKRIARSRSAEETMSLAGKLMLLARNPDDNVNILTSLFNSVPPPVLQTLLAPLETGDVVRLAKRAGMENVVRIDDMMRNEYIPYINRAMSRASKLAEKWKDFVSRSPEGAQAMSDVMFYSNMVNADPALAPSVTEYLKIDKEFQSLTAQLKAEKDPKKQASLKGRITKRRGEIQRLYFGATDPDGAKIAGWNDVPAAGKQIFREARDYYRADFNEHYRLLMQRIDDAQFKEEDAARLKDAVDAMFKEASKRIIYFPLKRFGDYWVSVGKGKNSEFHMFESASEQDAFIAQLRREGETREIDASKGKDTLRLGLRKNTEDASAALKSIMDLLDKGGITEVDALKDHVFQMYLTALPEADMRRRFVHRQFKIGFSTDTLRTFANTAIASANQLGRLAYNYKFKNLLDQSYAETAGNPSKRRLDTITREMEMRIDTTLSSGPDSFWEQAANLGAKGTFLFLLSSPKSAIMNLTQLHIVGAPTLSAEFGETATYGMMAKYTGQILTGQRVANPFRDENGDVRLQLPNFTAEGSAYIRGLRETDPDRYEAILKAWDYAREREVTESTFSSAANVYERSAEPSSEMTFTQAARQGAVGTAALRATTNAVNAMGTLFHHTERMGREIMYMSAFELAYDRNLKQGMSPAAAGDAAMKQAAELTNKGMFDFSSWNKSRAAKNPVGKLALQMRSYSLSMTSLLFRSFVNMIGLYRTKAERLAAARVFFGVGAMTMLYGGLRASQFYALGMLGYGLYEFLKDTLAGDEEDEEVEQGYLNPETIDRELMKYADKQGRELSKKDMDLYIRSTWIPETFGAGGTMQEALGLSDGVAKKLETAADIGLPGVFGVDISNSVALTSLWHPVDTKSDDPEVEAYETLGRIGLGPSGALFVGAPVKFLKEANAGNFDKAIESIMPMALRGFVKAQRLADEGLVVGKNRDVVLKDPSFYDTYSLTMQSLGFPEAQTSREMQMDIRAGELEREIADEKTVLLDKRYRAILKLGEDPTEEAQRDLRTIERDIEVYNLNYPSNAITNDTKKRSFKQKQLEAAEKMYGLGLDSNIPVRQPMVERRVQEFVEEQ